MIKRQKNAAAESPIRRKRIIRSFSSTKKISRPTSNPKKPPLLLVMTKQFRMTGSDIKATARSIFRPRRIKTKRKGIIEITSIANPLASPASRGPTPSSLSPVK